MDSDRDYYIKLIESGLKSLEAKTDFLGELFKDGRKDEALTLCCCYIEAAGNNRYGKDNNRKHFVKILKEHGGEEVLSVIHPKHMKDKLLELKGLKIIGGKVAGVLVKAFGHLYTDEEMINLSMPVLDQSELTKLSKNLWRGTLAAIVYEDIRSPLVHRAMAPNYYFSTTTFKGEPVAFPDFDLLFSAWERILSEMKDYSLRTVTWMGSTFPPEWPK